MKLLLKLTLLLLAVFGLWSFTTNTNSVANSKIEPAPQTQPASDSSNMGQMKMSAPVVDSAAINAGKELYGMKCKKCHKLHKPDEFTQDKWENKVLPKMSKKAKLTDDELKSIETYLFAFSSDKVKK